MVAHQSETDRSVLERAISPRNQRLSGKNQRPITIEFRPLRSLKPVVCRTLRFRVQDVALVASGVESGKTAHYCGQPRPLPARANRSSL